MSVDDQGHRVLDSVSDLLQVPVSEILSSRSGLGLKARKVAYVVMRDAGMTYPEIARVVGRDHSTVLDGHRKATAEERELASKAQMWLESDLYQLRVRGGSGGAVEVSVVDPRSGQRVVLEETLAEELVKAVFLVETQVLGLR